MKKRSNNRHCRNTRDHKRLLQATICQKNGQPGRNGQILRKVQPPETEPGRNRQYKQTKDRKSVV